MPRPLLPGIPGRLAEVSRWRRLTAALGAIGVVALAVGIILGTGLAASSKGASSPTKSTGSATVQRRDLVETDTESGTLSYANPQTVFSRLSGTITSLPAIGQVKKPGETLYKVDGAPVVLFDGTIPAYRDLSEGVSDGRDVQELKQNLVTLGFDPNHQITINQTYDAATAAAVDNWQSALGETQTGTVTLGQVVFLPGPQRITSVDTVLGSTGGASGSGSGSSGSSGSGSATGASTTVAPARPEFVSLTTTTPAATTAASTATPASTTPTTTTPTTTTPTSSCSSPSQSTTTTTTTPTKNTPPTCDQHNGKPGAGNPPTQLAALLALLKAETLELKKSGSSASSGAGRSAGGASSTGAASGRSSGGGGGSGGGSAASSASSTSGGSATGSGSSGAATAQATLQTTSTQLVVTVDLDATKQTEAVVGEPVTVELPDGSNADGKITAVSPVAQTSSSSSSSSSSGAAGGGGSSTPSATVPVTITLTGHRRVNGLDQAAVSVNFEQQKANNVLSVPVTALVATAGGGYAVQKAAAPQHLVRVTPGLFAAGYVQISGSGVFPGLQVTDSQG